MPADHLALQQDQAAEEEGQVDPFRTAPTDAAEGGMAGEEFIDGQAVVVLEAVQGGGLAPAVHQPATEPQHLLHGLDQAEVLPGRGPLVELGREGHQRQGVAEHGGVERVLAEAAEQGLAEQDGEGAGAGRQPPGRVGRQGQGQQRGADQGAAFAQQRLVEKRRVRHRGLVAQAAHQGLAGEDDGNGHQQLQQAAPAVLPEQRQQARQAGDQHQLHAGARVEGRARGHGRTRKKP
ncbi:hypothetical protein D9M70_453050 [compost metagenome]